MSHAALRLMDEAALWQSAMAAFAARDWFDVHEFLEELWRRAPAPEKTPIQGLLQSAVTAAKAFLAANKDAKVTIAGYASEEGAPDHNLRLSQRRAAAKKAPAFGRAPETRRQLQGRLEMCASNRRRCVRLPESCDLPQDHCATAQAWTGSDALLCPALPLLFA